MTDPHVPPSSPKSLPLPSSWLLPQPTPGHKRIGHQMRLATTTSASRKAAGRGRPGRRVGLVTTARWLRELTATSHQRVRRWRCPTLPMRTDISPRVPESTQPWLGRWNTSRGKMESSKSCSGTTPKIADAYEYLLDKHLFKTTTKISLKVIH